MSITQVMLFSVKNKSELIIFSSLEWFKILICKYFANFSSVVLCVGEGRGGGGGADLLDLLDEEEKTPRFQSSFSKPEILGDNALDMFIDRLNPYNRQAHPALPNVMKQLDDVRKKRGTCTVHSTVFTLLRLLPSHFKVF